MKSRAVFLLILTALLVSACAEPQKTVRYYSPEEEEQLRKLCEPAGCVTIPTPMFKSIIDALNRARGRQA